ncbi:Fc receptor-like protein 3 isoform X3 [Amia ocellicauda]|uniref:Fc receptor-like protein 3 isoform X3 n=1 Tax=Amia ocellicauda TaxID=2972642 RepID=UPI0034645FD3
MISVFTLRSHCPWVGRWGGVFPTAKHNFLFLLVAEVHNLSSSVKTTEERGVKMKLHGFALLIFITGLNCDIVNSASVLQKPTLTGPDAALLGINTYFQCVAPAIPETIVYVLWRGNREEQVGIQKSVNNEPARFTLPVTRRSNGNYSCEAKVEDSNTIRPQLSNSIQFKVIVPPVGTYIATDAKNDALVLFEGDQLTLHCEVVNGTHLSYDWFFNMQPVLHKFIRNRLLIDHVKTNQSGDYYCVARNQVNETNKYNTASNTVTVTIKVRVSKPDISYTVTKENLIYQAHILCKSVRGTPPVTFILVKFNRSLQNKSTEALNSTFTVQIALNQHMGDFHCRADNGAKSEVFSEPLMMEVVPVGGPVTLQTEHFLHESFRVLGIILTCSVERGSFPRYFWFLNESQLEEKGDFHSTMEKGRTLVLSHINPQNTGSYHCEARDSFDDTHRIRSQPQVVKMKEFFFTEVIALVFCCYFLLLLLLAACCIYMSRYRTARNSRNSSSKEPEEPKMKSVSETQITSSVGESR